MLYTPEYSKVIFEGKVPVIVVLDTVCDGLTVYVPALPVVPDSWVTTYVPAVTPVPESNIPGIMSPDVTADTVKVVVAIDPVKTASCG